jgi:5-methylcytosine-specific restriction endonuclease McrA
MSGEYRRPYEFSNQTKQEALSRAENKCDHCGKETKDLSIHHLVSIWFAIETKCLATEAIKSLSNAAALCRECHQGLHTRDTRAFYEEVAPMVLAAYLSTKVDHTKDSWRYDRNHSSNTRRNTQPHN